MKSKIVLLGLLLIVTLTACTNNLKEEGKPDNTNKSNIVAENKDETQKVEEMNNTKEKTEENAMAQEKKQESNKPQEKKQENSKPQEKTEVKKDNSQVKSSTKKTIVLDPGHSSKSNLQKEKTSPDSSEMKIKDGGGASGIVSKTPEYEINMKVALKLKDLLEKEGYNVIMTKTKNEESLGNVDRAEIANKNKADLVIRLHCDSSEKENTRGASMLVPGAVGYASSISKVSKKYGETILASVVKSAGMKSRGVIERKDLTGFNWSKVPVVLIEMGFLSNPQDDSLLNSDEYQYKIVKGIMEGTNTLFK